MLATSSNEFHGQLSPDGRWLAYTSDESAGSGDSVYVRPFPADGRHDAAGARWLVSGADFGRFPRWRSDGKQLFYTAVTNFSVMAADVDTAEGSGPVHPAAWSALPPPLIPVGWNLTPDAQRFLFITSPNGGRPLPFTVVLNWAAALKK